MQRCLAVADLSARHKILADVSLDHLTCLLVTNLLGQLLSLCLNSFSLSLVLVQLLNLLHELLDKDLVLSDREIKKV